jgi:hypothetical protein
MYIFIDEAGGFQPPSQSNPVSCVAALIIPESFVKTLLRKFRALTRPWWSDGREAKGSELAEAQIAQVVGTIRRFDVLLLAVAIDMSLHSEAGIRRHRDGQVQKILASISDQMVPSARARVQSLATRMGALSNQLYVQSVLLTLLVDTIIRSGTLYYVQRLPRTLAKFSWRVDAKDVAITNYESLWRDIVGPFLQTESLSTPLAMLKGADYSSFQRYLGEFPMPPEHLRAHVSVPHEPFGYMDINAILADLKFRSSKHVTGIQAVDMLASAVRRACNGTLQAKGWKGLGRLMPRPERGSQSIRFVALEDFDDRALSYSDVIHSWDRETKRMIIV